MNFSNLSRLRTATLLLLSVYFVVTLGSALHYFLAVGFWNKVKAGRFETYEELLTAANALDLRDTQVTWISLAVFAVSGIASLVWIYKAAKNTPALTTLPQYYSPGWSVGWYFVPIVNLWKPFGAMNDLWRRSAFPPAAKAGGAIGWWWALWLVTTIAGRSVTRAFRRADEIETILPLTWAQFFIEVATLPLICVFAWLIASITRMQNDKYASSPTRPADTATV